MTSGTRTRGPAHTGGHSALRRLVAITPDAFAREHWGRAPLLTRAADLPEGFGDLFGNDDVDVLVSQRGLRAPFLRVAKNGTTLPDRAFTSGGGVGAAIADQASDDKLLALFADGATLVLQALHRSWPPITTFAQDLAAELGHPVQVNAYVTPAQNTGFSDHYDVHDVFVLQIAGEKRWRVRPPVLRAPLRDQPWTDRRSAVEAAAAGDPLLETTLRAGDCLYLPRGYLHAATALSDVSTHLTIGIHPWTRGHLADELVAAAVHDISAEEEVRASLPVGIDLADPDALADHVDLVRNALAGALDRLTADDIIAALAGRQQRAQRAAPLGPLAQTRAARLLDDGQVLTLRRHLAARLVRAADHIALESRAGRIRLTDGEADAVQRLLEEGAATVSVLGSDLARRLVLGGVAVSDADPG